MQIRPAYPAFNENLRGQIVTRFKSNSKFSNRVAIDLNSLLPAEMDEKPAKAQQVLWRDLGGRYSPRAANAVQAHMELCGLVVAGVIAFWASSAR